MRSFRVSLIYFLTLLFFHGVTVGQETGIAKLLSVPYIGNVEGAANVDRFVFTVNEKGHRNVYVADGPDYAVRKLTQFDEDDAQEITSLSISADGNWAVFARGGDHGSNSAAVATNSASLTNATKIEVYTVSIRDNKIYKIGLGDFPQFSPHNEITYLRGRQVWTSPLNRESAGKQLFQVSGSAGDLQWSPDGSRLAFISRRGSHSFLGIYTKNSNRIQWIAPAFQSDASPRWSPDGTQLAFVRRPATGGALDSITAFTFQPWSIMIADTRNGKAAEVYKAPSSNRRASYPRIGGGVNLKWVHPDYLTFMSYEDGWPHLYRLDHRNKEVLQLTKGDFAVEDLAFDRKGERVLFSANTGNDKLDFERTHIGLVNVKTGQLEMLTQGEGLETGPSFFNGDNLVLFKGSGVTQPVQPIVYDMRSKKQKVVANELFADQGANFVKPEQVFITSEDGVRFSAQYFEPQGNKKNLPALVYIHGGPRRQMYLGWHHRDYYFYDYILNQYLASQGYAVLSVNYRLGTGYGYDFQHAESAGALGASEYNDILAAGKWLQAQKDIDKNRIGVFGGSYGGFLTAMALAKNSDIFKAGVDIHGVHNRQRKQNPDFYAPDFELASKLNWDSSPSRWVDGWRSPVLLIHGDDDGNVAFSHSIDLFNRLQQRNVDVEILVLPDENHHWQLFENLVKVKEATADFLDRKLK